MSERVDWLTVQPWRCFFYPGRDCPGWHKGQPCAERCSRIGQPIPEAPDGE
jgi:hypothetical protein